MLLSRHADLDLAIALRGVAVGQDLADTPGAAHLDVHRVAQPIVRGRGLASDGEDHDAELMLDHARLLALDKRFTRTTGDVELRHPPAKAAGQHPEAVELPRGHVRLLLRSQDGGGTLSLRVAPADVGREADEAHDSSARGGDDAGGPVHVAEAILHRHVVGELAPLRSPVPVAPQSHRGALAEIELRVVFPHQRRDLQVGRRPLDAAAQHDHVAVAPLMPDLIWVQGDDLLVRRELHAHLVAGLGRGDLHDLREVPNFVRVHFHVVVLRNLLVSKLRILGGQHQDLVFETNLLGSRRRQPEIGRLPDHRGERVLLRPVEYGQALPPLEQQHVQKPVGLGLLQITVCCDHQLPRIIDLHLRACGVRDHVAPVGGLLQIEGLPLIQLWRAAKPPRLVEVLDLGGRHFVRGGHDLWRGQLLRHRHLRARSHRWRTWSHARCARCRHRRAWRRRQRRPRQDPAVGLVRLHLHEHRRPVNLHRQVARRAPLLPQGVCVLPSAPPGTVPDPEPTVALVRGEDHRAVAHHVRHLPFVVFRRTEIHALTRGVRFVALQVCVICIPLPLTDEQLAPI
mmetsp:Transcript_27638/g.78860  ORF Transcript_27638/g.78860 Transcript_27638/m.78860 type:complete len:569 (+) Transcript_27638:1420-3126(+)